VDYPTQPSSQQYIYRFRDGAEPRLSESNVYMELIIADDLISSMPPSCESNVCPCCVISMPGSGCIVGPGRIDRHNYDGKFLDEL